MGFTPVNEMQIKRDLKTRKIIITWHNDIIGKQEKEFSFEEKKEALVFAAKEFNQFCI